MMISQIDTTLVKEEAARLGEAIYEQQLRPLLEPTSSGQVVAIHLPSGDYFLGRSLLEATDRLRQKYPSAARGEVYARGVGQRAVIHARTPRVTGSQE
jgi:hypothetical protein